MIKPKVGLLPFYLELYDNVVPNRKIDFEKILGNITDEIKKYQVDVISAPICRVREEFENSISMFEEEMADAIITLHMAYSPSLESIESLASTKLPIIVLDTTPAYDFSPLQDPDEILFNHGIHGVQDMCNLLIRNKKTFQLEVGHWKESNVIERVAEWSKAAALVRKIRTSRVGLIGGHFNGMGDFLVPDEILHSTIGIETIPFQPFETDVSIHENFKDLVENEMAADSMLYDMEGINENIHRNTVHSCLTVRCWLEQENLTAFTMNFLGFNKESCFMTVPFMEAGKAMSRGIGYAGEGDVLTAALVGALLSIYPDTIFTEMFCPDWNNNTIFLSHMAELNTNLVSGKVRLSEMDFIYTDADNPLIAFGRYRSGKAFIVNLAPSVDNGYSLIIAAGEIVDVIGEDKMEATIHGWFKPTMKIEDFLSAYSLVGGTHHSAMVYEDDVSVVVKFGKLMGWNVHIIG